MVWPTTFVALQSLDIRYIPWSVHAVPTQYSPSKTVLFVDSRLDLIRAPPTYFSIVFTVIGSSDMDINVLL